MGSRDQIRAADNDRERVASRLQEALEEGRLTLGDYDERLKDVYAARTFGDLDRVLADLPAPARGEHSQVARVPPSRHEPNPRLPGWLSMSWRLWFAALVVSLTVWFVVSLITGTLVFFFPLVIAGPWAVANVALMIVFPPRHHS